MGMHHESFQAGRGLVGICRNGSRPVVRPEKGGQA